MNASGFWRRCRVYFRWARIAAWLALLGVTGALVYLNQVGLPGFVKRPLLEKLRARGLELEFSRLRLSWYRGIVAENVRFGRAGQPLTPRMTFGQVQVRLNYRALARRQFQVDALALRSGRLVWPVPAANDHQAPRELALENIQTDLRFLPHDEWALDNFKAEFAGARLQLSGTLTHASAARNWTFLRSPAQAQEAGRWEERLAQLADALDQIHFAAPLQLRLNVLGDARDLRRLSVRLVANVPAALTPWGTLSQGRLGARLLQAANSQPPHAELSLGAGSVQTRWADLTNVQLLVRLEPAQDQPTGVNAQLTLKAADARTRWAWASKVQLEAGLAPLKDQTNLASSSIVLAMERVGTQWGSGANARLTGQWVHGLTNLVPLSAQGRLECAAADTQWCSAGQVRAAIRASRLAVAQAGPSPGDGLGQEPPDPAAPAPGLAWPPWLCRYALDWECEAADLRSGQVTGREAVCSGSWRTPLLTLSNLHAAFDHGQIDLAAGLNVASRELEGRVTLDADAHQLAPLLPEAARRWLDQFTWEQPPRLAARAALVLPAWTNLQPDWHGQVQTTLRVEGEFNAPRGGAYRGLSVSSAQAHFSYSNQCWRLPDLLLTRPEGRVLATHQNDERAREFYWRVAGSMDPSAARPLLDPGAQRGLEFFTFTQPPVIEAEIWGRQRDGVEIGIQGRVALTNFTFRGEWASGLVTSLRYTNQVLELIDTRLQRSNQVLQAEGLQADFRARKVFLTNGFSTTEPMVVARAIGPHIARTLEPYRFIEPPTVRAHGTIPMEGEEAADLHFQVQSGPFHWLSFNLPRVEAGIYWKGLHLTLSDARMDFYGGQASGSAMFYFDPAHPGADYQMRLSTTNTLLQALIADLSSRSNHLEGRLSGALVLTKANTEDWRQTAGYGALELRDGLIWDIPLFGRLSPALDALVPGLGSSRASAGACSFVIVGGVIRSDNLDIRSPAMRLEYSGTADLKGRLNARVEAMLLRDMPLFGPLVSRVFWPVTKLFEYKVTGTVDEAKMEPLRLLPRIVLMPLHPLRTLKSLLPPEDNGPRTNASPPFHW